MTTTTIRLDSAITVSLKADYTAESVRTATQNILQNFGQVMKMSFEIILFFYCLVFAYTGREAFQ